MNKKVYLVMNRFDDFGGNDDVDNLLRIFDTKEKAIEYIMGEIGHSNYTYDPETDEYSWELEDWGVRTLYAEEWDVY